MDGSLLSKYVTCHHIQPLRSAKMDKKMGEENLGKERGSSPKSSLPFFFSFLHFNATDAFMSVFGTDLSLSLYLSLGQRYS